MESMYFTKEEQDAGLHEANAVHFASSMGFLNSHNGFRLGSVHTMIGTTSGGKTTLVRSILRDLLFNKQNERHDVSIWLSEETCKEYKRQLMFGLPPSDVLKRGVMLSEEECQNEDFDYFIDQQKIIRPSFLIYDNITTSRHYEGVSIHAQKEVFRKIKLLTKEINCATLVIGHTTAEVNDNMDRLMNTNDIRGSKFPSNQSEFFYVLQKFKDEKDNTYPTIRILKHRGQDLIHPMYLLHYKKELRSFTHDTAIQFDKFKEIYAKRQKLK